VNSRVLGKVAYDQEPLQMQVFLTPGGDMDEQTFKKQVSRTAWYIGVYCDKWNGANML